MARHPVNPVWWAACLSQCVVVESLYPTVTHTNGLGQGAEGV